MEKIYDIEYKYYTEGEGFTHSELMGQNISAEDLTAEGYIEGEISYREDFTDEWWEDDTLECVDAIQVVVKDAETGEALSTAWAYKR